MKKLKTVGLIFGIFAAFTGQIFSQNILQFTSDNATDEGAIQLHWASNSNEVYEIDYANALATNTDGSTAWFKLYSDYPSHGTNTFIADCGNYDLSPEIVHPKFSPMRFYRVMLMETNTSLSNPTISIVSPTNGASLSGSIMVEVSATSSEILTDVKLYIDGEQQWPSDDSSNFVINTCEWPNGNHIIYATAKSQSGLEGAANGATITYGRSVSAYANVTFSNLISRFTFSQAYFQPTLEETQQVTATFAANVNWTLQIQDINSNTVRTATGDGTSMEFDWDGTGDGETSIPDGVYTYLLSVETNGESGDAMMSKSSGRVSNFLSINTLNNSPELWTFSTDGNDAVPMVLYPPGFDTNGLTIISATPAQVNAARALTSHATLSSMQSSDSFSPDASGSGYSGSSTQSSQGPTRKPTSPVKGQAGTFGILYKRLSEKSVWRRGDGK